MRRLFDERVYSFLNLMPESLSRDELLARARRRDLDRDHKGACEDYSTLAEREPGNLDWLLERGRLRMILRDEKGALEDFRAAAAGRPGDAKALYYVAYARAHTSPAEAQADYLAAAKAEPKDAAGFYYRGLTCLALHEARKAHLDFAEAGRVAAEDDPVREMYLEKAAETEPFSIVRKVKAAPATWALVAINVAVMFVFNELLGDPSVEALMKRGAVERYAVRAGEVWRLLTAVFLHIGAVHLIVNAWGGVVLCTPVEKALGTWRFLAAYLACGVAASAVSVVGHHVVAAGSSGALFGIDGILLVLLFRNRPKGRGWVLTRRIRRTLWSMGIWFLVGLAGPFDNWAHAGGLVFGVLLGVLLIPKQGAPFRFKKPAWGAVSLLWLGVILAAIIGFPDAIRRRSKELSQRVTEAEARGDRAAAEQVLTEALGSGLDDTWIRVKRGSLRQLQGNAEGAREDYLAVVNIGQDSGALWGLGFLEAASGRHEKAVTLYDQALGAQPGNPDILVNRATSLAALGRKAEAIQDLKQALASAPADWAYGASTRKHLEDLER